MKWIPLLFLVACTPTILDWAPVRPPPVPGVGLPSPRAPTFTPAAKPQSQPKPVRLLPQTPETRKVPGLWSATAPMASDEAHPRIGEHYLVYPPDASPEMMQQVNICARFMNDALERADHDKARRAKMAPMEVFCLTARLFEQCPKTMLGIWDKQRKNGDRFDPVGHKAMKGVRDFSLVFREEICRELFPASPEAERLFNDAVREFIRTGRYLP